MTTYDIVCLGLEAPADVQFQEAMRPELQRRMLELTPPDWLRLLAEWPQRNTHWITQLCDTLSPAKHGQPAATLLMDIAVAGPWSCAIAAAEKLLANQALNATECDLLHGALTRRDQPPLGHHAARHLSQLLDRIAQPRQQPPVQEAAEYAMHNRAALAESLVAACYYCQTVFQAALVSEYADGGQTALCPYCGTDAVLPSRAGYDFSPAGLQALNEFWFI